MIGNQSLSNPRGRIFGLILVSCLIPPFLVLAQTGWEKCDVNPVVPTGQWGDFDCAQAKQPSVLYDGGVFKMWYVGKGEDGTERIGYAESDGGVHWNKKGPVLPLGKQGEFDNIHQNTPMVLKIDGVFLMWYGGYDGSCWRLGKAASPDGITWEKSRLVFDHGAPGDVDGTSVLSPFVMRMDSVYRLWYGAYDGIHWRICLAESPDLIIWTRKGIALDVGPAGAYDSEHATHPEVFFDGEQYRLLHGAFDGTNGRIGSATSPDGLEWTKTGFVLSPGQGSDFDCFHVADVSVLRIDGQYRLWYSGGTVDKWWQIGLAGIPKPSRVPSRDGSSLFGGYHLGQNTPNPFNGRTRIPISLPRPDDIRLVILDQTGREVTTVIHGAMPAGNHEAYWDGRNSRGGQAASGVYLYRLSTRDRHIVRKMLIAK